MTSDQVFDIPPAVVARRVRDEMVILYLDGGTYFGLDPVGARIWELISEGRTLSSVCELMLEEYDVTREALERDVSRLVGTLIQNKLLEVRS